MPYSVHYTDTEWEKERKEVQGRDQPDLGHQIGGEKQMKNKIICLRSKVRSMFQKLTLLEKKLDMRVENNTADVAESIIHRIEEALGERL